MVFALKGSEQHYEAKSTNPAKKTQCKAKDAVEGHLSLPAAKEGRGVCFVFLVVVKKNERV